MNGIIVGRHKDDLSDYYYQKLLKWNIDYSVTNYLMMKDLQCKNQNYRKSIHQSVNVHVPVDTNQVFSTFCFIIHLNFCLLRTLLNFDTSTYEDSPLAPGHCTGMA